MAVNQCRCGALSQLPFALRNIAFDRSDGRGFQHPDLLHTKHTGRMPRDVVTTYRLRSSARLLLWHAVSSPNQMCARPLRRLRINHKRSSFEVSPWFDCGSLPLTRPLFVRAFHYRCVWFCWEGIRVMVLGVCSFRSLHQPPTPSTVP